MATAQAPRSQLPQGRSGLTNGARLWRRIEEIAELTDRNVPWTRRAFTDLFLRGRAWLREQYEKASLTVSTDAAGNLVGRREGKHPGLPPIVTGSHTDTVVGGGRFDGILGVLAGIEVAQTLEENALQLRHPLEVVDFLSEEPSDYGISCVGSRAMVGLLDRAMIGAASSCGETLAQGIERMGGDPGGLAAPLRKPGDIAAFVELHIEQGPVLEHRKVDIGVVTHIVGIHRTEIRIEGRPDHSGTTPMSLRQDALVGASRVIEAAYSKARREEQGGRYLVATVGRVAVAPNAINAVPGRVELMLEVRSDRAETLESFAAEILDATNPGLEQLGLRVTYKRVSHSSPTQCSDAVQQVIEEASSALGYSTLRLPSGAGHDGVYVSRVGPIGMIFVPCRAGRSHCAEEWSEPDQVAAGARVLYETIHRLDVAGRELR